MKEHLSIIEGGRREGQSYKLYNVYGYETGQLIATVGKPLARRLQKQQLKWGRPLNGYVEILPVE